MLAMHFALLGTLNCGRLLEGARPPEGSGQTKLLCAIPGAHAAERRQRKNHPTRYEWQSLVLGFCFLLFLDLHKRIRAITCFFSFPLHKKNMAISCFLLRILL